MQPGSDCTLRFLLAAATYYWQYDCEQISIAPGDLKESYDFIIVGSGSAGSVLANRLTKIADWNVLILEQGGTDNPYADIPFIYPELDRTPLSLNYKSTPQEFTCGLQNNSECPIQIGHGLGGGSAHNGMIYARGSRIVYDQWPSGWTYDEILPYFIKQEQALFDVPTNSAPYHGHNGPIGVSMGEPNRLTQAWLDGARELGQRVGDYNSDYPNSFSVAQSTIRNGSRDSTFRAYLQPVLGRENLNIMCFARVTRIRFEGLQATGVEFVYNNVTYFVKATREVIVSAGAFGSPKLLMLSGIGKSDDLSSLGIEPVLNLPGVGENYMNFDQFLVPFTTDLPISEYQKLTPDLYFDYKATHRNKLSLYGAQGIGFLAKADNHLDTRVEYSSIGIRYDVLAPGLNIGPNEDVFYVLAYNVAPFSRGKVSLNSANPNDQLRIDPRAMTDKRDVTTLKNGVKFLWRFNNTQAFRAINAQPMPIKVKQCQQFDPFSDEGLVCQIRYYATQINNYSGTCKMGYNSTDLSVVDNRLRVHGVKGLRVIDASVFPIVPRANTNPAVIMLAEKASDIIKEDYGAFDDFCLEAFPSDLKAVLIVETEGGDDVGLDLREIFFVI